MSGVPLPPYEGSSLDQRSDHSLPAGGASSGSAIEVREEQERRRCVELLTLEQHRRVRTQEQQGRHGAPSARARQRMDSQAARRVRDLIVVLEKRYKRRLRQVQRRRAADVALPMV